ncbi:hypothetical protein CY34DRAFT_16647 [Suillus luteus UH-Slu-Lm8-n1]|uniref:Uncharacterized protein n=1 Tax=Suillus luteus UH-Slu-Lm8-n1 TaxID=930992 RepID=A0A0C9ZF19_9AGAM|nr:hypothetical protein CY34DRAFT_16647 [Suillus luteus UH-Slu-Lm8-n1]
MVNGDLKRTREGQDLDDEQIPPHRKTEKFQGKMIDPQRSASIAIGGAVEKDTEGDGLELVDPCPNALCPALRDAHGDTINSLLDRTALYSQGDISARFDSISNALLSGYYVSVIHGSSQTDYEILELEFYLQKARAQRAVGDIAALSAPSQPRSVYMYLRKRPPSSLATSPVFRSPRIELDLSNPETKANPTHPRINFVGKLYRYFAYQELLIANRRIQTFVGLYLALVEGKEYEPGSLKVRNELRKLTGMKDTTLATYLSDYQHGFEKGKLADFVGALGKGASALVSAYLRMMGTLGTVLEAP